MIAALVDGKFARAQHGKPAICPACRGDLYARMPAHAVRHWAHKPLPDGETRACARDSEGMTEWHREWQETRTDLSRIEVAGDGGLFYADVINEAGLVVEFQHSRISEEKVKAREQYWRKGCWVADGTTGDDGEERARLERLPDETITDGFWRFKWSPMPKLIYVAKWPVWIDLGEHGLLQVKSAQQGRGRGWLVDREWFIDNVVNGTSIVLHAHAVDSQSAKTQKRRASQAREEKEEDLSDLPVNCIRPIVEGTLDAWLREQHGRCPICGWHPETQGHDRQIHNQAVPA